MMTLKVKAVERLDPRDNSPLGRKSEYNGGVFE